MTRNFATFDIEEWYHANYDADARFDGYPDDGSLERNTERLLQLCGDANVRATCFVLGSVAERKPAVVRLIHAAGHEVASHGFAHGLVYRMSAAQFRTDAERSKRVLEDVIGGPVTGYRAPSWSVDRAGLSMFYDALAGCGFGYSSSIFPVRTFLYGIPDFPRDPHYPVVDGVPKPVLEIPGSVLRIAGRTVAFSGGFFLRLLPGLLVERLMAHQNRRGRPVVLYLHPRELDGDGPRLPLAAPARFIHYHNIRSAAPKLRRLFARFRFQTMAEYARAFATDARGATPRSRPVVR